MGKFLNENDGLWYKYCSKCDNFYTIDHFSKSNKRADGLQIYCKQCKKKMDADWYSKNKDIAHKKRLEWARENKDKVREYCKKGFKKRKENITDSYVVKVIANRIDLTHDEIRKNRELIEFHRQSIKLKRLVKQIQKQEEK